MKNASRLTFICIATALTLAVTSGVLTAARSQKWWWDHGGGPSGSHFVDLDQVNKSNVKQLEVAWFYPHGNIGFNPIVVDDMMFVSGRGNSLVALDPTTGKEIWIHENLQLSARGINYWQSEDGKEKRLLFAAGPYLQAIDAKTGKSIMTFGSNGYVDLRDGMLRGENGIRVPNPGKVWKNLLILGNAPGEGWMSPPGDIRAFDVITGKLAWQFHTVPRPGEFGYETWPKDAWKYVGGANTWGELTDRRRARHRLSADRIGHLRLLRRRPARRQPVRQLPACARREDRQASLALPEHSPRLVGLGQRVGAAACDDPQGRAEHRHRGDGWQDGLPVRLQSRHRRADLADRRAAGAADRHSR